MLSISSWPQCVNQCIMIFIHEDAFRNVCKMVTFCLGLICYSVSETGRSLICCFAACLVPVCGFDWKLWIHSESSETGKTINSLCPSDTIWRQRSGSTLAQVMPCCLTAPSHYLNQCWLIISEVQVTFILGQFHKRCLKHQSLKSIWNLHI